MRGQALLLDLSISARARQARERAEARSENETFTTRMSAFKRFELLDG
jgi:hypothetical protein